jgi:hypothetical protein
MSGSAVPCITSAITSMRSFAAASRRRASGMTGIAPTTGPRGIVAGDFRPLRKNSLQGFVNLKLLRSGLILRECSIHEKNGRRWIGLPGKPQVTSDGCIRKDPATGKTVYVPIVEIRGRPQREQFQAAALAAVDKLLGAAR